MRSSLETILVFGGNNLRTDEGMRLAASIPGSKIIVSATARSYVESKAKEHGVDLARVECIYTGLDTLSELATTKKLVLSYGTKTLHLVSDHWHMPRIHTIADVVYLSSGIKLVAHKVYIGANRSEPKSMVIADRTRACFWRMTGLIIYSKKVRARAPYIKTLANH